MAAPEQHLDGSGFFCGPGAAPEICAQAESACAGSDAAPVGTLFDRAYYAADSSPVHSRPCLAGQLAALAGEDCPGAPARGLS